MLAGFHTGPSPQADGKATVRKLLAKSQAYSLEPLHSTQGHAGSWPQAAAQWPDTQGPPVVADQREPHQKAQANRKTSLIDRIARVAHYLERPLLRVWKWDDPLWFLIAIIWVPFNLEQINFFCSQVSEWSPSSVSSEVSSTVSSPAPCVGSDAGSLFVLNNCTAMGTRATIKANKCMELNKKCTSLFSVLSFPYRYCLCPESCLHKSQYLSELTYGKGRLYMTGSPAARKNRWWEKLVSGALSSDTSTEGRDDHDFLWLSSLGDYSVIS